MMEIERVNERIGEIGIGVAPKTSKDGKNRDNFSCYNQYNNSFV